MAKNITLERGLVGAIRACRRTEGEYIEVFFDTRKNRVSGVYHVSLGQNSWTLPASNEIRVGMYDDSDAMTRAELLARVEMAQYLRESL